MSPPLVCAYCEEEPTEVRGEPQLPPPVEVWVSHGICDRCLEGQVEGELRAFERRDARAALRTGER